MTSKERVIAAFEHRESDIVPRWIGAKPEFWAKAKAALYLDDEGLSRRFGDDFRRVWPRYVGPHFEASKPGMYKNVFGVEHYGIGSGVETVHPLGSLSLDALENHPWPDPTWWDVSHIKAAAEAWNGEFAILGGDWSCFWHDAFDLAGMENLLMAMVDSPEFVDALFDRLVGFYLECSRRIFDAADGAIDIFFLGNDFGTQLGPMVSEDTFRRFVQPQLTKFAALGHDYGLKVMLHCCGGIAQLIPSMIESGIDGLHAVQPSAKGMDLRALKTAYGDKILFNGGIDSQHVLMDGTPESVRRDTLEVLSIMAPGGGYVAGASHDTVLVETPVENVVAMFDAVAEFSNARR